MLNTEINSAIKYSAELKLSLLLVVGIGLGSLLNLRVDRLSWLFHLQLLIGDLLTRSKLLEKSVEVLYLVVRKVVQVLALQLLKASVLLVLGIDNDRQLNCVD